MKYTAKTPCGTCAFRSDKEPPSRGKWWPDTLDTISKQEVFPCHHSLNSHIELTLKGTVDYRDILVSSTAKAEYDTSKLTDKTFACAGNLIYGSKAHGYFPPEAEQAILDGEFDYTELDFCAPVWNNKSEIF